MKKTKQQYDKQQLIVRMERQGQGRQFCHYIGSRVRSEALGAALFPGLNKTTAICGQKALLLCRSLTVGGKKHSLGSLVESRDTLRTVSLSFRKPLHLPADTDREGQLFQEVRHRDSLF